MFRSRAGTALLSGGDNAKEASRTTFERCSHHWLDVGRSRRENHGIHAASESERTGGGQIARNESASGQSPSRRYLVNERVRDKSKEQSECKTPATKAYKPRTRIALEAGIVSHEILDMVLGWIAFPTDEIDLP